jgi:hypothetical protein
VITEAVEFRIEEAKGDFSVIHRFNQQASNIPQIVDAQLALLVSLMFNNNGFDPFNNIISLQVCQIINHDLIVYLCKHWIC